MHKEDAIGGNVKIGDAERESNGIRFQDNPLDFAATMRILRVDL